jgi:hypothetical protein
MLRAPLGASPGVIELGLIGHDVCIDASYFSFSLSL